MRMQNIFLYEYKCITALDQMKNNLSAKSDEL